MAEMTNFREFDMVALLRDFPEYGLEAGAVGGLCDLRPGSDHGIVEFPGPDFPFGGIEESFALTDLRQATDAEIAGVRARNDAINWDKLLGARGLARLGGSDANAKAPPRRRPS